MSCAHRRKRRALTYIVGGTAMVAIAAIACTLFLYFALRTDFAKDNLRKKIEAKLSRTVGSAVAVGDIGDPGLSSVELSDVVIENRIGTPAIMAEHVAVTYDPVALLGGELETGSIRIAGLEVDTQALTRAPPAVNAISSQAGIDADSVDAASLPVIHLEDGSVILEGGQRVTDIAGAVGISVEGQGLRIDVHRLSGKFRGARAEITGTVSRGTSWQGRVQIDLATPMPNSQQQLHAVIDAAIANSAIRADATVKSTHARGRAHLELPVAWPLTVTAANATLSVDNIGALVGHRALGAGQLSLTAHGPLSRLEITGTAKAEAGGAHTEVKFRGTLPDLGARISVEHPAGISARGRADIDILDDGARARLSAISASTPAGPIRNGRATLLTNGGRLSLRGHAKAAGGNLGVTLRRASPGSPVTLTADLKGGSLAALDPLLGDSPRNLRARGPVSGRLSMVLGNPESLRGRLEIDNGRAVSPLENHAIRKVDLTATVTGKNLAVSTTFDMAPGSAGQVSAELRGQLSGWRVSQFSGHAEFHGARVHARDRVVVLTGRAQIRGRKSQDIWRTDLTLNNARLWLPYSLDTNDVHDTGALTDVTFVDSLSSVERPSRPPPSRAGRDSSPHRAVRRASNRRRRRKRPRAWLHVKAPGGVRVYGDDIDVRIIPDVAVGVGGDERFDGAIEIARGEVTVLGRRYRMAPGRIQFSGLATAGKLDLRLHHRFKSASLALDVTGTIAKPLLAVSSQPAAYTQRELFAFVAGGTPDTGPLNGTSTHPRIKHQGKLATAVIANQVGQVIRRFVPVDVFSFTRAEPRRGDGLLTVGTWLEDDLFVAYRRRIDPEGGENANEMAIEYRASEEIIIEGAAGDRGRASLDLLWVKRD